MSVTLSTIRLLIYELGYKAATTSSRHVFTTTFFSNLRKNVANKIDFFVCFLFSLHSLILTLVTVLKTCLSLSLMFANRATCRLCS